MQQHAVPLDGDEFQEPSWSLASYRRRVGAWALDIVLPTLWIIEFIAVSTSPLELIGKFVGEFGFAVNTVFGIGFIIIIGYMVWWMIVLTKGQTPGKQLVGIRVIKDNGEPSGWGYTFLREFVIKFLLVGSLAGTTLGTAWLVDNLWPLWDRAKKMQTLHDKLLGTLVVRNR